MEYLRGYQIYCDTARTLTITGSSPSTSFSDTLQVGDNLVGVDISNNGKAASAAFFDIAYSTIKWYNPATATLEDVDSSDTVYMGRCYWLAITASSTYSVTSIQATTTFTYDGDGGRVKKTVDGHTTAYVGSLFEKQGGTTTRHIFLGDTRICSATGTSSYSFYHGDHLGSTSDVTDKNGELIQHTEYTPYGEFSPSSAVTDPRVTQYCYTGKLYDSSTELYFYSARYYDPSLARFITADTIVPDPGNSQSYNRYSYTEGNPINYTDPTGHFSLKEWVGKIVGAVVGVITYAATGSMSLAMAAYGFVSTTIDSYNAGYNIGESIGIGILSGSAAYLGAEIGGAFGAWVGGGNASAAALGSAIFGGAFAGAAGGATHSALTGGNVGLSAATGGISGGITSLFSYGLNYQKATDTTSSSGSSDPVTETVAEDLSTSGNFGAVNDIQYEEKGVVGLATVAPKIVPAATSPGALRGLATATALPIDIKPIADLTVTAVANETTDVVAKSSIWDKLRKLKIVHHIINALLAFFNKGEKPPTPPRYVKEPKQNNFSKIQPYKPNVQPRHIKGPR